MKKIDNFARCLDVIRTCNAALVKTDQLYRTGLIGQFSLSFELGWKALQAVLLVHGVQEAATGSPREIIKQGYRVGFLDDEDTWLAMLKRRNTAVHVYSEAEVNELTGLILQEYLPVMDRLRERLTEKSAEITGD